jgi:diguanylate cyclase (GGDEF)-like protein
MFLFELAKEVTRAWGGWSMTLWQSHTLTIAFSTLIAGVAAHRVLARQASTLLRLSEEAAARKALEAREVALAENEDRLWHEAFHDSLTGLANRALFRDRLSHALALVARKPGFAGIAVLVLDLDQFKTINDSLGHPAGDRLLRIVADRLSTAVREGDTVARLGGDEFAILLEGLVSDDEAMLVVERIDAVLGEPELLDGRRVVPRASMGVAFATDSDSGDTLVRNADVALYEAKENPVQRYRRFEPAMYTAILERLALQADLELAASAPATHGFALVYQPIVELGTGRVRGIEALLRWTHGTRGSVSPQVFVPAAEECGAILPIGHWVLEEACRQLAQWHAEWDREGVHHAERPTLSVNVSGRQLVSARFVRDVEAIIAASGIPASTLTLELTESVILEHTDALMITLSELRALGIRLAVDDFGTGYASLSYLQRFPLDVLKVDRSFVESVAVDNADQALVRAIVALGRALGLHIVAEGIEHDTQRDTVRRLGCQFGQGFLFARPQSAVLLGAWMRDQRRRASQATRRNDRDAAA